jgi:hypothetical protein
MPEAHQNVQPASAAGTVYTLFSVLIPSTLLLSFDRLSRDSFEFLKLIPWWFILIAFACNLAASGVLSLLNRKHAEFSSFVRVNFFIYFPAMAILTLFLYETPQLVVYLGVLLLIQWIIAHYIFNRFKVYRKFKNFVAGYRGDSLKSDMRSHSLLIRDSYESLKNLRKTVHIMQLIVFAAVSALLLAGIQLSIFSLIAAVVCVVTGLVSSITLSTYIDEYRFYIDGMTIHETLKQKRFGLVLILLVLCGLLILPLLRDVSLFPTSSIINALNWIVGLFPDFKFEFSAPDHLRRQSLRQRFPEPEYSEEYQESPFFTNLSVVIDIMGIVIAVLLVLGVLYFLLRPLFKKGIKNIIKDAHPLTLLVKQIKRFVYLLKQVVKEAVRSLLSLFGIEKKPELSAPPESGLYSLLKPKRTSLKKSRQKNRVVRAFIILIKWGTRRKINFHPSLGPKEYINLIIEYMPRIKEHLTFIAETFEEAVFSTHIMQPAVIRRYIHDIKAVIRS